MFTIHHLVGATVGTPDGSGIVRMVKKSTDGESLFHIELDCRQLSPDGERIRTSSISENPPLLITCTLEDLTSVPMCALGTCVLTSFGPGVLVKYRASDDVHCVRLWSLRGSGSAISFLNRESILKPISASFGLKVNTSLGGGTIIRAHDKNFSEFIIDNQPNPVAESDISCPVAQVMPLIEIVADRSASIIRLKTRAAHRNGTVKSLFKGLAALEPITLRLQEVFKESIAPNLLTYDPSNTSLVDTLVKAAGNPTAVKEFQGMLELQRDEFDKLLSDVNTEKGTDSETLLRNGRDCLDALLSDTPASDVGSVLGGALQRMPSFSESYQDLVSLLEDEEGNSELQILVAEVKEAAESATKLQNELESTKAISLLKKGGLALGSELEATLLVYAQDPNVMRAKENSLKLLQLLMAENSPAIMKAKELADKAYARFEGQNMKESVLGQAREAESGGGEKLRDAIQTLAKEGERAHQAIMMLKGETGAGVASDNMLRFLEDLVVEWVEHTNKINAYPIQAADLVQRFKSGRLSKELVEFLLRRGAKEANDIWNNTQEITKFLPNEGVVGKVKKMIGDYGSGTMDLDDALSQALTYLNSTEGEAMASHLIESGGRHLAGLKVGSNSTFVKGILTTLGDPNLENKLIEGVHGIDADGWLDMGEKALTDEHARMKLFTRIKDATVAFLLEYLPTLEVPPISGMTASKAVSYAVANLDLSGFQLSSTDVEVIFPTIDILQSFSNPEQSPYAPISEIQDQTEQLPENGSFVQNIDSSSSSSVNKDRVDMSNRNRVAFENGNKVDGSCYNSQQFELFSVVARGVQASFRDIQWAYEQESFPYGSDTGRADAAVVNGSIRIGFSLKQGNLNGVQSPLLVMSSSEISMEELTLSVVSTRLAWLLNLLASIFSDTIKEYVCKSLQNTLDENASELLGVVNDFASGSWPLLVNLMKIDMSLLPVASPSEVAIAKGLKSIFAGAKPHDYGALPALDVFEGGLLKGLIAEEFSLVFDENGPLGLQVDIVTSKEKRILIVADLRQGSQAERRFSNKSTVLIGSEIISVGEIPLADMDVQDALKCISDAPRPITLHFRFYMPDLSEASFEEPSGLKRVSFSDKVLGLRFEPSSIHGSRVTEISGFSRGTDNLKQAAERSGLMFPGQILYSLNGSKVLGRPFSEIVQLLKISPRPIEFGLLDNPEITVTFESAPLDLELQYAQGYMVVTDMIKVQSSCTAKLKENDILISVNNILLPSPGDKFEKDIGMTTAPTMFPLKLQFLRNGQLSSFERKLASSKIEARFQKPEELPFVFKKANDGRPYISRFELVDGPARLSQKVQVGMVLVSINGTELRKRDNTSSACLSLFYNAEYPASVKFRNLQAYFNIQKMI